MRDIEYRYELKYEISAATAELLKHQLRCLMSPDSHSVCDEYSYDIRSLYFDNPDSSAYFEKLNGEEFRKKYPEPGVKAAAEWLKTVTAWRRRFDIEIDFGD